MFGELIWLYNDRLANHYGAAVSHVDRLESLESELLQICSNLEHREPNVSDLSNFFSNHSEATESTRYAAWLSQNLFDRRAWCVGQKILSVQKGQCATSPIVEQMESLGLVPAEKNFHHISYFFDAGISTQQDKIDCVCFSPKSDEIFIIKAQTFTRAKKLNPWRILKPAERAGLFHTTEAFVEGLYAPSAAVMALSCARDVLSLAFPSYKIRAYFLTLEEPGARGRFQLNLLPNDWQQEDLLKTSLDVFAVAKSHEDYSQVLAEEPDSLFSLPKWPEMDFLQKSPVDLATRAVMILKVMADGQRTASKRLWLRSAGDIAKEIGKRYRLKYTKDMIRHDLDRLQRLQLVNYAPNSLSRLALTSAGMFRVHVIEHRFNRMVPRSPERMLEAVRDQEALWLQGAKL